MAVSPSAEKIVKLGYHIRPKYDLHGLRQRRTGDQRGHVATELPLTSMIDMFSILVIYLLMNFSATGDVFFMAKPGVKLPAAERASPLESAPLISYSKGVYFLDAIDPNQKQIEVMDNSHNLVRITAALKKLEVETKAAAAASNGKSSFDAKINLQADENVPLLYIKRAMVAATSAGWTSMNFVVENRSN